MASNWLDLQRELRDGITSYASPIENTSCAAEGQSTTDLLNRIDLPDLTELSPVDDILSGIQGEIDEFGAEVMGVLQDIGAWIPPELSGTGTTTSSTTASPYQQWTTSTEVHQTVVNSEVTIVDGKNEFGEGVWGVITSSGTQIWIKENGSIHLVSKKSSQNDADAGQINLDAEGNLTYTAHQMMSIKVHNERKVAGNKAFSLSVSGDVDIHAIDGDVSIKGKNIILNASDKVDIKGASINIHAGGATPSTDAGASTTPTYGGTIDMRCGDYKLETTSQQKVELTTYTKTSGELAFIMDNPLGNFGIQSAGNLSINVAGDMSEQIGGRKLTSVFSTSQAAAAVAAQVAGTIKNQSAGYLITTGSPVRPGIPPLGAGITPPLLEVTSATNGFKVSADVGDIEMYASTGNYSIANSTSAIVGMLTAPKSINAKLPAPLKDITTPGFYINVIGPKANILSSLGVLIANTKSAKEALTLQPMASKGKSNFIYTGLEGSFVSGKPIVYLN